MIMQNKRGSLEALHILIAVLIIALLLGVFFLFISTETLGSREKAIESNAAKIAFDQAVVEYVSQSSKHELLSNSMSDLPVELMKDLTSFFLGSGFKRYYPESVWTVECHLREEKKLECISYLIYGETNSEEKYSRSVFIPIENGVKEVTFSASLR